MTATETSLMDRALTVTACPTWDTDRRFPVIAANASGCHLTDVDGRRFIDFTSCSGAAPLGADHPAVVESAVDALRRAGISPSTLSPSRIELAERLVARFPAAEKAVFFRTGSCATTAAARLARVHTGRPMVLTSGFHGWHDWHLQARPDVGMPHGDPHVVDFGYDLDLLGQLLAERWEQVAAVVVTPETAFFPDAFLREVVEAARGHGALVILDEVMTGFRFSAEGYHGTIGIRPDLVALSKGLANGMALSAVVGRAEVVDARERTYLGYTFQREIAPFTAALATLDVFESEAPIERMHTVGRRVIDGFNQAFTDHAIAARAYGTPSMFRVTFEDDELGRGVYQDLFDRGILMEFGGVHMISAATSDDDVAQAVNAMRQALEHRVGPASRHGQTGPPIVSAARLHRVAREGFQASDAPLRRWCPEGTA